ncbi:MAG: hypothetical protein AUK29_05375 [Nitrospirae bacterium CG2_30_53_67]|nr:MAG: hypothetical protein AUK29_05375 [Nitrospirae bacterium CG2_30_53_67]
MPGPAGRIYLYAPLLRLGRAGATSFAGGSPCNAADAGNTACRTGCPGNSPWIHAGHRGAHGGTTDAGTWTCCTAAVRTHTRIPSVTRGGPCSSAARIFSYAPER